MRPPVSMNGWLCKCVWCAKGRATSYVGAFAMAPTNDETVGAFRWPSGYRSPSAILL